MNNKNKKQLATVAIVATMVTQNIQPLFAIGEDVLKENTDKTQIGENLDTETIEYEDTNEVNNENTEDKNNDTTNNDVVDENDKENEEVSNENNNEETAEDEVLDGEENLESEEVIIEEPKTIEDNITDINIYHTNDTHARVDSNIGFAKFKEYIDETSKDVDGKLVLDAGDTLHGQSFATLENGESVAKVMKAVGYDAISPGNHDFNYGQDRLKELGQIGDMKILAGNVTDANDNLKYEDTMIKEIDGVKVGVFGIATPETEYKTNPNNVKGLDFGTKEEVIQDTKEMVKDLEEQGADIVVGLGHLGIDSDSELKSTDIAKEVEGIDLLIDGHSHSSKDDYQKVGDTIITSSGEHFKNVGMVNVQYDKKEDKLVEIKVNEVSQEDIKDVKEDEEVKELIDSIKKGQEKILNEVIGNTSVKLDGERESVRYKHTNLGNLITNSMISETGADIALTNGGGIRASINEGEITKGEILTVLPFGNYIVTIKATGQQIIDALNHGLVVGAGSFTHFAGMDVKVNEVKDGETTKYKVVSAEINGKEIDKSTTYTVATNDFLAVGGDNYTMLGECELLNEYSSLDEALIRYIQKDGDEAIKKANKDKYLKVVEPDEEDEEDDDDKKPSGGNNNNANNNNGNNNNNNSGNTNKPTNPQTSDAGIMGYIALGVSAIGGLAVNTFRRKRK
ncbi:MAG: bifunctional metallophosphatase/5'-nucleotidase [Peptostreptococcaceae bacterium]